MLFRLCETASTRFSIEGRQRECSTTKEGVPRGFETRRIRLFLFVNVAEPLNQSSVRTTRSCNHQEGLYRRNGYPTNLTCLVACPALHARLCVIADTGIISARKEPRCHQEHRGSGDRLNRFH